MEARTRQVSLALVSSALIFPFGFLLSWLYMTAVTEKALYFPPLGVFIGISAVGIVSSYLLLVMIFLPLHYLLPPRGLVRLLFNAALGTILAFVPAFAVAVSFRVFDHPDFPHLLVPLFICGSLTAMTFSLIAGSQGRKQSHEHTA